MGIDWAPGKGPKTRRLAEARFHQLLHLQTMAASEDLFLETARKEVPEAWHTLEMDVEAEGPKEKVTLYLDRAVIAMFRKMGKGYQARINRILETWMQMKMAEKAVFRRDVMAAVDDARAGKNRPDVGARMMKEYEKLVEMWAYEEGWQDAVRRMGEGGPVREPCSSVDTQGTA